MRQMYHVTQDFGWIKVEWGWCAIERRAWRYAEEYGWGLKADMPTFKE